jgi:transcriptional regulator with XRE-family HTH domain
MRADQSPAGGETIGQRVKRIRLERGLSQRELAAPGVSYAYISRIEAGTRQPSVKALRKLSSKLGVSAHYLETGSDLDATDARELRLTDLELAVRLGESEGMERALRQAVMDATAASDTESSLRGRVALAALVQERGDAPEAIELLEAALADEPFLPAERLEVYGQLGRAYASTGNAAKAVDLFQQCLEAVVAEGGSETIEARYSILLSYALTDIGEIGQAEDVLRNALDRVRGTEDPYMRVRLYWSMARLAHNQGRPVAALRNIRKAIALLEATEDALHLARAHVLAGEITLARSDADAAAAHLDDAESLFGTRTLDQDVVEIKIQRSRIAAMNGDANAAIALAQEALSLETQPADEGLALGVLGDALALADRHQEAHDAYEKGVGRLEAEGRWRDAANTCRAWARVLRRSGHEEQAMDVLERATVFGLRAAPSQARTEH